MVDYKSYDIQTNLLKTSSQERGESHVLVVDIDEKSLNILGQWPWPRIILAEAINKINAYHPSAIGLDLIFPEKDRTSPQEINAFYQNFFNISTVISGLDKNYQDNDAILAKALKNSQSILGLYLSDEQVFSTTCENVKGIDLELKSYEINNSPYMACNTAKLRDAVKNFGFLNMQIDEDGILRRMPLFKSYEEKNIPTFALATLLSIDPDLKIFKHHTLELFEQTIRTDKYSQVLLNSYSDSWYKKVSMIDLLNGKVSKDLFKGKIVLIGSSAVALHDQVTTSNGKRFIGVKIHITLIDNLLNGTLLYQPENLKYINTILSLIMSLLFFYLLITKHNNLILFLFIGVLSTSLLLSFWSLKEGLYISTAYFLFPYLIHFFLISMGYIIIDTYERKIFTEELNRSHVALLDSMVHVAEVHDIETGAHIIRTKKYIKHLANYIYKKGLYNSELTPKIIDMMFRTAPLHDLGKVGIEDAILKKPGKLTPTEYETMKTHAKLGKDIINNAILSYKENEFFIMARNIANYHHEKWDGSGYPEGLIGATIPIEARFMAIADVYDALVSRRVYKEPFDYQTTIQIIKEGRGTHFDPLLVDAFLEITGEFEHIAELYADHKYVSNN